jgi:hypothetical protein
MPMDFAKQFSLVVNSINPWKLERMRASLARVSGGIEIPCATISDAKSMAEGLNRGAAKTDAPYLIFCHDDIAFVSESPLAVILCGLQYYDLVGVAGTDKLVSGNWYDAGQPHIQGAVISPLMDQFDLQLFGAGRAPILPDTVAMDGIFMACRHSTFDRVGGFDEQSFDGWHGYDVDFSYRIHLAGGKACIASSVLILHDSHPAGFSQEKVDQFLAKQKLIEQKHLGGQKTMGEQRVHESIMTRTVDDALRAWKKYRGVLLPPAEGPYCESLVDRT